MNSLESFYKEKSENQYYSSVRKEVIELIEQPVDSILEVGCGSGNSLLMIKKLKLAKHVVGIDINKEELEKAKVNGVDNVFLLDIEHDSYPLQEKSFDIILCPDVLEHLSNPWRVANKLRGLLKDDGRIIASIPNVQNLRVLLPLICGRWDYKECGILDKTHLRFFTKRSAIDLFKMSGFNVINTKANLEPNWLPRLTNILTLGLFYRFVTVQFLLVATKNSMTSNEELHQ